jgi:uncharacterized repeat protein (TIGR02543 family)
MAQIWYDNFSTDKSWTLDNGAVWERGSPAQDPPDTAYDGSNVIATDLSANYPDDISPMSYATSPTIDCSGYTNVAINFRRHAYFENVSDYDEARIEVYDGESWQEVWTSDDTPANIEDGSWTLQNPSISTYGNGNANFQIRFGLDSDTGTSYRGWFIDAVEVTGDVATNYQIEGKTYSKNGPILATCKCLLLKDNQDDTCTVVDYTTSDGNGDYNFTSIADDDSQYFVYAWKDDSPHIFDVTDHNLLPKETPDTSFDLYLRSDTDKSETSPDKDLRLRSDTDKVPTHTVTFSAGSNGSVGGDDEQEIDNSEDATEVTADAANGYVFNGWTGDHTGLENALTLTNITEEKTVTANFGTWDIDNVNYITRCNTKKCYFCGMSVPAYDEIYCDCKKSPYPLLCGVRESIYGLATQEATHEEWNNAFWGMHWRVGRAPKIGLFNISAIIGNDCRFNFADPGGVTDPDITFTGTDTQESMFDNFDDDGDHSIYLGIELGEADPTEAIEVALDRYGGHSCVAGIVIDLEWWDVDGTGNYSVQLTKTMAESWLSTIQGYDAGYKLLLRHPDPDILPPNDPDFDTDIWCICDDQGFIGLDGTGDYMIPMFQTFVDQFPNHTVILQIGYNDIWSDGGETRNDKDWWDLYDDPPSTIAAAIIDNIASMDQTIGIVWVDFSLEDVEIDLLDTPDSTALWDDCELHSNSVSGMHIPANAPIHSDQYDKQKYL